MAVGEKIKFDINRFLLHWTNPEAIGIICETREEFLQTMLYLESFLDITVYSNSTLLDDLKRVKEREVFEFEFNEWVSIYCAEDCDGILHIHCDGSSSLDNGTEITDYLFTDIEFEKVPKMVIYQNSLMNFLNI